MEAIWCAHCKDRANGWGNFEQLQSLDNWLISRTDTYEIDATKTAHENRVGMIEQYARNAVIRELETLYAFIEVPHQRDDTYDEGYIDRQHAISDHIEELLTTLKRGN